MHCFARRPNPPQLAQDRSAAPVQARRAASDRAGQRSSDQGAKVVLDHDFSRVPVHSGISADPGELEQPPLRLSAHVPAALPAATPAWTSNGEIYLGPAGLFLPPQLQRRMLRHEAFHRLHQRSAPVSDAADARQTAEQLAAGAESGPGAGFRVPVSPAPALLAFPPQPHAPWDQVWIGYTHIIGEVTEEGVAARLLVSYKDIGITRDPGSRAYHCGRHDRDPIPKLVARLRKAAKQAAALNAKIPQKDYALKTAVIAVYKGANSAFRVAGGLGVLVVKEEDSWEGTIAHEGSHGIFSFHLGEGVTNGSPDALAKGIGELYLELKNTIAVSIPTHRFDRKRPPLKDDGKTSVQPAGLLMVMDTLWTARAGLEGGHPWETADEFFASAYGAYQNRSLFDKIVRHYGQADPSIPALAQRLATLLDTVGDAQAVAALPAPKNGPAADAALARVKKTPEIAGFDGAAMQMVTPSTMPGPETISCPAAKPARPARPAAKPRKP